MNTPVMAHNAVDDLRQKVESLLSRMAAVEGQIVALASNIGAAASSTAAATTTIQSTALARRKGWVILLLILVSAPLLVGLLATIKGQSLYSVYREEAVTDPTPIALAETFLPPTANPTDTGARTVYGYTSKREPRKCYDVLQEALEAVADKNKQVMVAVVNAGYVKMTLNLVRSWEMLNLENFLLIAIDQAAGDRMQQLGLPCVLAKELELFKDPEQAKFLDYWTTGYIKITQVKPVITRQILELGYDVMMSDSDVVWLRNVYNWLPLPDSSFFSVDYFISDDIWAPCTGFYWVRATSLTVKFWRAVEEHQRKDPKTIDQIANAHIITEFQGQGKLTRETAEKEKMRWYSMPRNLFPVGKIYWWEQQPQREGVTPYVIHNNWVVGLYIKEYRFRESGLWFLEQPPEFYAGKFVAYDSVELDSGGLASKEKQQEALRNALAIASVLGRVLILPKVKCNGLAIPGQSFKIEPTIDWCDTTLLQGNFDAFEKTFQAEPGFREHSIIHHAGFQRYNRTQRIHIVANDGRKESGSVNVVPKDIHCGLTEQELKEAVAPYAEVPVLWFSSLYHRFKGPEPGTLKTRLQDQFASLTAVPYGECVWW